MDCHGLRDAMKKNMPEFEGRGRGQGFSGRKRMLLFSMGQAGEAKAAFKQRPEGGEGGRQTAARQGGSCDVFRQRISRGRGPEGHVHWV